MAPRKRTTDNNDLKDYPGLHRFPDGRYYVIHPVTNIKASLKTRDRGMAIQIYTRVAASWAPTAADAVAQKLLDRLSAAEIPRDQRTTFREFAQRWRETILGFVVNADGTVTRRPTKVTKKNGDPIEDRTHTDYGRQCRQLEQSEHSSFYLTDKDVLRKTRKLLAPWADKPVHYNHLLAVVSHVFKAAIVQDLATDNPAHHIEKMGTRKREVYIPDADYLRVTDALMKHEHHGNIEDGEWMARICDLLYMLSSRPGDAFKIKESNLRLDLGEFGEVHFGISKTKVGQEIIMNAEMREQVDWFLAFKRKHRIFNKGPLLCYPPYMRQHAGKAVSHRFMQDEWAPAVVRAGFTPGQYRLADLRKKGLTDEFVGQGENDKGGHKTQAMRNYYRLQQPPKRASNTLVDIRKAGGEK